MSHTSIWFTTLNAAEQRELAAPAESPVHSTPDLLVVGGGLVGLATAYFAAERGLRVQLIEAAGLAHGASGANAGGVCPNVDGVLYPAPFRPLAFLSRDLWGRLSVRPGLEFEWRVPGFLVIDPERLRPSAAEAAAAQQEQDFTVQAVDGEQLALLEPALRPGIPAGLLYPSEAHLHPVKAALSLARGLQLKGGRIRTGVQALSLETSGGKVVKVHTTAGSIEPGCVIAATGWDTRWLAELRPPALPLNPLSGQLIATDPLPPLLKRPVAGRFLVLQLRSGEIVTGGTVIPGEQATPDAEASREFAAAARELVPALRDVPFPHAWCGTRAGTPDGLPIVDRLPAAENLFVTTGHFKKGVLLAPACGKLLSDWVATDCCPEELEYFSWRRFAGLA